MKTGAPSKKFGELGARYLGGKRCSFLVWAPKARSVHVHILAPKAFSEALDPAAAGYFYRELEGLAPGARYKFRLNGEAP
jgi:maltooligosyltrehalose trehalohydrolase